MRASDVEGHEFLVARVGDRYFVTDNHCPHLGGRLSKGNLEGTVITCHLHHSQFDLTDGRSSVSGDADENNLGYYAGVQYDFDHFAMRLGYEQFDLDSGRDANETMLSFFYKL